MIRSTVQLPDGGMVITAPTALDSTEYRAFDGPGVDGRGPTFINAPGSAMYSCNLIAGNDDSLCFVGDCHGSVVVNCAFPVWFKAENNVSKALIGYCNAESSATPGPVYGAADGYASNFFRCKFDGGAIRLRDGVWHFVEPEIVIGPVYGIDLIQGRINLINPRFKTMPQPKEFGYWYQNGEPCGIRVKGSCKVFISGATLDGIPVSAADLVRRYPTVADAKAGRTAYGSKGVVPFGTLRSTPN